MNKNQVKGHANEAKGNGKEVAGKVAGDKSTEYKGKVEKPSGTLPNNRWQCHRRRGRRRATPRLALRIRPAAPYSKHGSYASRDIGTDALAFTHRRALSGQRKPPAGLLISVSLTNFSRHSGRHSRDACDHGCLNPKNGR